MKFSTFYSHVLKVDMEWQQPLKTHGPAPSSRRGHTMTRLLNSSTVVVFAGESEHDELLNDMYTFDITTATWQSVVYAPGPVPHPRYRHSTTAISSTAIVVIGGDSHTSASEEVGSVATAIDAWLFDLRTFAWARLSIDDSNAPAMRGGHSAVFAKVPGHSPGIYLFGGFGVQNFSAIVYRLRTADWKWERVYVMVERPDGSSTPVSDPHQYLSQFDPLRANASCPCPRESHIGIWVPSLTGMLIFGGESDTVFHSDFWLFSPVDGKTRAWRWRQLNVRMARNFVDNAVPSLAAASGVLLPMDRPMLLIWAGLISPRNLNFLSHGWVVDLMSLQSVRISVNGLPSDTGRVLHAIVRFEDRLLLSGGVDAKSDLPCDIQVVKLVDMLQSCCTHAADFGEVATRTGQGAMFQKESTLHSDVNDCSAGTSTAPFVIPKDTSFSGKVTVSTEFGTHVSVVINGRVHQGLLIAFPNSQDDDKKPTADENESEQITGETQREKLNTTNEDRADNAPVSSPEKTNVGPNENSTDNAKLSTTKSDDAHDDINSANTKQITSDSPKTLAKKRKHEEMMAALIDPDDLKRPPLVKGEVIMLD